MNRLFYFVGIITLLTVLAVPFLFVNIPILDDWTLVHIVDHILIGKPSWIDFWAFQGEQRLPITRLILSYWAAWTSWDLRGIPWLNLTLLFGAAFFLIRLVKITPGQKFWREPSFFLASIFLFSLPAVKTINWSINLNVYLSAATAICAIVLVSRNVDSLKSWLIAALLGAISIFSFGMGVVVWFSVLPVLAACQKSRNFIKIVFIWLGSAIACLSLYFNGFIPLNQQPLHSFQFFVIYLGALFHPLPAIFFGALGIILIMAMLVHMLKMDSNKNRQTLGLFCVALFVLGNGLLITLTRSRFGPAYALADRYMGLSCYFWTAIALWLHGFLLTPRPNPFVRPILIVLVVSQLLILPLHWWNLEDNRDYMLTVIPMLRKEPPDKAELQGLFELPGVVEEGLPVLKTRKLSIFR